MAAQDRAFSGAPEINNYAGADLNRKNSLGLIVDTP